MKKQVEGEGRLKRELELNAFFRGIGEVKLIEDPSYSRKAKKRHTIHEVLISNNQVFVYLKVEYYCERTFTGSNKAKRRNTPRLEGFALNVQTTHLQFTIVGLS